MGTATKVGCICHFVLSPYLSPYKKISVSHSYMHRKKPFQILRNVLLIIAIANTLSCKNKDTEPVLTSGFYNDDEAKLWKHRVNCVEDADTMASIFPGIEIDIYYVDSTESFVCTHGEPCGGASLETLLSSIQTKHFPYVWLDFKNSEDSGIVAKSIPILKDKLTKLNLTKRTIIETKNTQCLDSLNKYGLYSSYWVPHYYDTNPSYTNEEMIAIISNTIEQQNPTVLSADYHMIGFLKLHFPDAFLHLWVNGLTSEADKATINELKAYHNTKVILVDFVAPF